jgi:hypothetical protein
MAEYQNLGGASDIVVGHLRHGCADCLRNHLNFHGFVDYSVSSQPQCLFFGHIFRIRRTQHCSKRWRNPLGFADQFCAAHDWHQLVGQQGVESCGVFINSCKRLQRGLNRDGVKSQPLQPDGQHVGYIGFIVHDQDPARIQLHASGHAGYRGDLLYQRQIDGKSRSFPSFRFHMTKPFMRLDDTVHNSEPQTGAALTRFGREKWFEHAIKNVGRNATTAVTDRQPCVSGSWHWLANQPLVRDIGKGIEIF